MTNVKLSYQNDAISGLEQGFLESIPEGYRGFADVGEISSLGMDALLSELLGAISGGVGEAISFFLVAFGVTLIFSLVSLFSSPLSGAVRGGVSAAACMAMFASLYPLFSQAAEALGEVSGFFGGLVPTLTAYLALGGGGGTATAAASGLGITLWLTGLVAERLLMPMTAAVFASSLLSSAVGGVSEKVGTSISRSFGRLIGIVGATVAAAFALQTYISVAADSVSVRAAKYAASGLVPAVGGVVSGAISTLGGGLAAVGGIIGASSVAIIVAMAISPLALLLLHKLALYLCSLFLEFTGTDAKSSPVAAFMGALNTLISVYAVTMIIYIFEIIVLIWGGKSILG